MKRWTLATTLITCLAVSPGCVTRTNNDGTCGSTTVTDTYAGPALETGLYYQFRATSFRDKNGVRTAISSTEDLTGVFQFLAPD